MQVIKRVAKGGNFKNPCKRVTCVDSMKVGRDLKLRRNESWGASEYVFAMTSATRDCLVDADVPGVLVCRDTTSDDVYREVFAMLKGSIAEQEFAEVRCSIIYTYIIQ